MKFTNMKLLNDVILDYSNPDKIYKLAREYDRLEQGSAAFSYYLRAADMSPGKTIKEKWLQYKCMILGAFIYERNGDRDHSVEGLLKIAIDTFPDRPEAYYFLSKFKQRKNDWREAMMYAAIGLNFEQWHDRFDDDDLGYPGINALRLLYARAKWKTDGRDESKNLAFNLKYKNSISEEVNKGATALLAEHGYPSTLTFTQDEYDRYKFKFKGINKIERNYSRHFQDMFVLSILDGQRNGTFVEIGSGHPELFNNTLLLEKEFGWKGISLDNSERMCHIFSRSRNSTCVLADAANTDYKALFKQHCLEQRIEYLRINAEVASITALKSIPFDKHEFSVLQFQHNAVWWGNDIRDESRKVLSKLGYILMVSDVAVDEKSSYEDWWVHPDYVKTKSEMRSSTKVNFAWNYMMEEL
jgi:hypothetical protein